MNNIKYLQKITKKEVGFSDHSIGTLASILATTLGAKIIEKHFTYNKNAKGADHKISADFIFGTLVILYFTACANASPNISIP